MSKSKDKFREFCKEKGNIPLFINSWWLDLVAGKDNWDVVIETRNELVIAVFPFVTKKVAWFQAIGMPPLTPYMGIWFNLPPQNADSTQKVLEKDIKSSLVAKLPRHDKFFVQFFPEPSHWFTSNWKGYQQTTQYTYIIEDLTNLENVYSNFKRNIKGDITKAKKRVEISSSENFDAFFSVCSKTFSRQKIKNPYNKELFKAVYTAAFQKGCGKIMMALDKSGNIHAVVLLVWDKETTYYLAGGGDHNLRRSGATSLLLWEAIQFAATVSRKFDFEGSMIPAVEKFFSAFGARQTPYSLITQTRSPIIQLLETLKKGIG